MKPTQRIFLFLLIAGIALRLLAIHFRPEGVLERGPDEDEYLEIARNLAHGNGFAMHGQITAYRDMLLPATASLFMRVLGDSPMPFLYFQVLLSCATAWLLYRVGKSRFGESVAVAMAGIWLLYPAAILFTSLFFTETLCIFLWLLALVLYDRLEESCFHTGIAALVGCVAGLAMLSRAAASMLFASLFFYTVFFRYETAWRVRIRAGLVMLAACALVIVPWMIRNYVTVGAFALNTNGGVNIFIGNNARANGSYKFDSDQEKQLPPESAGEAEISRQATTLGLQFLVEHPRQTLLLWGKKFAFLWTTDNTQWIHYFPNVGPPSVSKRLHEISIWLLLWMGVPYMFLVGLGISGFCLVREFPSRGLFILQIFFGIAAALLSFGTPRFHAPLMPALIVAAGSLKRPKVWTSAPQWRRLFLLYILGMFAGIWLFEAMTIAGV